MNVGEPGASQPGKGTSPVARSVLIIDDNRDAAAAMAMLVELLGSEAHVAHSSATGIELAREIRPQVVLLDISLPDQDGYATCRVLRAGLGAATRIIAITGWCEPEDRQRAVDAGFDAYVTKPPDPVVIERHLRG
jgi:CheY-like chemotaxis protein